MANITADLNITGKIDVTGDLKGTINIGGGSKPKLQEKTVTPTTTGQSVIADTGYDGLSQVEVAPVALQYKTVTPGSEARVVSPDTGFIGLSGVTVEAASGGGGAIPEIYCTTVPSDVFNGAVMDALRLPATSRINTGAFANINGDKHFDLYLNDKFYVITTGYPFGDKTDVTAHIPKSMRAKYDASSWEEFIYEHDGFRVVYED